MNARRQDAGEAMEPPIIRIAECTMADAFGFPNEPGRRAKESHCDIKRLDGTRHLAFPLLSLQKPPDT
jgi:hypothetical protein